MGEKGDPIFLHEFPFLEHTIAMTSRAKGLNERLRALQIQKFSGKRHRMIYQIIPDFIIARVDMPKIKYNMTLCFSPTRLQHHLLLKNVNGMIMTDSATFKLKSIQGFPIFQTKLQEYWKRKLQKFDCLSGSMDYFCNILSLLVL